MYPIDLDNEGVRDNFLKQIVGMTTEEIANYLWPNYPKTLDRTPEKIAIAYYSYAINKRNHSDLTNQNYSKRASGRMEICEELFSQLPDFAKWRLTEPKN